MNPESLIAKFGLPTNPTFREEIRLLLQCEIEKEGRYEGDYEVFRCLMVLLFSIGNVEDSTLIWNAKCLNFDLLCGMDIQFICGAGLEETIEYLTLKDDDLSQGALHYLNECVDAGDFTNWSPAKWIQDYRTYYSITEEH